jgi:hypothetical protein
MKTYFRVHHGPVFDVVKKHTDEHTAANTALVDWAAKHNLPISGTSGNAIFFAEGFKPDSAAWKKCGSRGGWEPRSKTPSGKVLKSEWEAMPKYPSWMTLIMSFAELSKGESRDLFQVNKTGTPGIIKNKSEAFYLLNIDDYWLPENRDGLEEIKASEYK